MTEHTAPPPSPSAPTPGPAAGTRLETPSPLGDKLFSGSAKLSSALIVVVVLIIGVFLLTNAWQPLLDNTASFFTATVFNSSSRPPAFGVAGLLWTTVLSSLIALTLAVPVAIGLALLLT
ncbi:MAG: phosphate ABC transporter permease subunit PstC, partial [Propionibacteriaceae bacterium]|nr:phosphate ABC transporter permease subunit PstC [Propionibacteriaceae bacterium]